MKPGKILEKMYALSLHLDEESKKRPNLGFIHFESNDGSAEGLLCPVRKGATK